MEPPSSKRMKISTQPSAELSCCKHYVQRKKRFCKMTVAKGREYCGEHDIQRSATDQPLQEDDRIACPLDPKHTVYRKNLKKHLTICNARPKDLPPYIVPDVNNGTDNEDLCDDEDVKLSDVDSTTLENLITRIEQLYNTTIKGKIEEIFASHKIMSAELEKKEYGKETMKHIVQTSALLGYLEKFDMLQDQTGFVEFGAGKGQVSYWLAQLIGSQSSSKIFLIDRASHRHKKDNKLESKDSVFRIRADIRDFCPDKMDHIDGLHKIVGVSKHLCGMATDLALRCLLQKTSIPISGFVIAVCCHHRCEWKPFIGKKFFIQSGFNRKEFLLMTKMASWAICGDGYSREKRKEIDEQSNNVVKDEGSINKLKVSRERRAEIGNMCKRIIDYSRVEQMVSKNFDCSLKYYVRKDITLENVCIVGKNKTEQKYFVDYFNEKNQKQ